MSYHNFENEVEAVWFYNVMKRDGNRTMLCLVGSMFRVCVIK